MVDGRASSNESVEDALLQQAGTWLLSQAREEAAAKTATWPQFAEHPFTTDTLYSGTAGVVAPLLTLAEITGEPRYTEAARRGVGHLLRSAVETPDGLTWEIAWDDRNEQVHRSRRCGLYNGSAGIAWVLLKAGDLWNDPAATKAGRRGFDWICSQLHAGKFWDDGQLDIISGSAGIVLALLDAHRITGDERYRDAARAGADGLLAIAKRAADGSCWPISSQSKTLYSGFSHGTAGVGYTLARVYAATGDKRYLDGALEAARWLDRNAVRVTEGNCTAWRRTEGAEPVWEGWCHGPAGTCRLHLLLHSLTGDARHLETAEAGARWIMSHCDPDKDRAGAKFFAPSLCCGAAGVGTFLLDLHRYTGKPEYLNYARRVAGFLDRVADRPTPQEACWSLSGKPELKHGKIFHGTNLMTGQGGYITFLARLAQQQQRLMREVVTPPDWTTIGLPPGRRLLVVEYGPGAERFHAATRRLASYRGVEWERLADAANPDALRDLARRQAADALAIVIAPETLDLNLNRRVLDAVCRLDDDMFPDASYGYLTGAEPGDVMTMLERMAAVERDGLPARGIHYGVATTDKLLVYPARPGEGGLDWSGVYIPTAEKCPAPRETLEKALAQSAGAGVITFSGNGDPMRVWLFSDRRNLNPQFHWPYDPARIVRDFASREMPALGASELARWDLAGRVVWFSTCHSAVPVHAMVAADIVATFGKVPDRRIRFYDLRREESFCLNLLARGPSAYLAPIGPNHGYLANVETYRAVNEQLPLGEAIRRNQIDVALTYRSRGGIPLVQEKDGQPEAIPNVPGGIMREGTLNRILFGDPTFAPFRNTGAARHSLEIRAEKSTVTVAIKDPQSPEHWDPYRGDPKRDNVPDQRERVMGWFELDAPGVRDIMLKSNVELTGAEWAIETRRCRPPVVWFSLNAPKHPEYTKRNLWREGARFTFEVKLATDSASVPRHGEVKR